MKLRTLVLLRLLMLMALAPTVAAMPVKMETIKKQLNLTMVLGSKEMDQCASSLLRKAQTLTYTCELSIPVKSKNAKFQALLTPKTVGALFGGTKREVLIEVSDDARVLSLTTSFDSTGLDLELSKFNDDFYAVYAQAAHMVISDALKKQPIKMEILESRQ